MKKKTLILLGLAFATALGAYSFLEFRTQVKSMPPPPLTLTFDPTQNPPEPVNTPAPVVKENPR